MKQGIVISTHETTRLFLFDLLESLDGCPFPIIIKQNTQYDNAFEMGGIKLGAKLFDEFLYLQDTVIIKNQIMIYDILSLKYQNMTVSLFPELNAYMGKYESKILNCMALPEITTKRQAVANERIFTKEYLKYCNQIKIYFPDIDAWKVSKVFEEKHGRNNCIYENKYFKKFKGTWKDSMIP